MKHVMIDLETLGTLPGSAIMILGAIFFDETGLGDEFYMVARQYSCVKVGLAIDAETASWWETESPEARKNVTASLKRRVSTPYVRCLRHSRSSWNVIPTSGYGVMGQILTIQS
jgi:hypothetical protein